MSCLLGGRGEEGRESKSDNTGRASMVEAALDFPEASQQFQSCATAGLLDKINSN